MLPVGVFTTKDMSVLFCTAAMTVVERSALGPSSARALTNTSALLWDAEAKGPLDRSMYARSTNKHLHYVESCALKRT